MKNITMIAVAAAAISLPSPAMASGEPGGRWEWRTRSAPGPRSPLPYRTRVWVKDDDSREARRRCAKCRAHKDGCIDHAAATLLDAQPG